MSRNAAEILMDRWTNDPSFAHQLKTDPGFALKSCGIEPTDEIVKSLEDVGPGTSTEELQARISKFYLIWMGGW